MLQRQPRVVDRRVRRNHVQRFGKRLERDVRVHQVQISAPDLFPISQIASPCPGSHIAQQWNSRHRNLFSQCCDRHAIARKFDIQFAAVGIPRSGDRGRLPALISDFGGFERDGAAGETQLRRRNAERRRPGHDEGRMGQVHASRPSEARRPAWNIPPRRPPSRRT